ncbi:MAG: DUF6915 family protein [Jhaorihella sp.]
MSDPIHHAMSSARKFGGDMEDYLSIHHWFDETKESMPDARHRALRHHAEGIGWAIDNFGNYINVIVDGELRKVSVRMIGEQHMMEDLGFIPTIADWMRIMPLQPWMLKKAMARPDLGRLRANDPDGSYDPTKQETDNE